MPYVQTQAKAMILQITLSKAENIAVSNIFKQQWNITVFLPVVSKTTAMWH